MSVIKHIFTLHKWQAKSVVNLMFFVLCLSMIVMCFEIVLHLEISYFTQTAQPTGLIMLENLIISVLGSALIAVIRHRWVRGNSDASVRDSKLLKFIVIVVPIGYIIIMIAIFFVLTSVYA